MSDKPDIRFHFDRHSPDYRDKFVDITHEMQQKCPLAWTDTYDGHWVAAGSDEVFELARCPQVSNDHDVNHERRGYKGISIPTMIEAENFRGGMLEMDDPEHRHYRTALNPYLSPAAVKRWEPVVDEIVRACIDDHIESGHIDFVDDLANVVPAVLTLAMLGVPLEKWTIYNEPAHASVYTPPDSPDAGRVRELFMTMAVDLFTNLAEIRDNPRPGIIDALATLRIDGEAPPDIELIGMLNLLIGGGFDTTTALTAHALEWLSQHPGERTRLSTQRDTLLNPATEEFLRYFTPAPGDGRTIAADMTLSGADLREGQRLWLSWAMANRDPDVFSEPDEIILDRKGNRHFSFGLGVHRCIGSNVARTVFKSMLTAVLDRLPDYRCTPEGTVHYDSIGVIQGMRHLPATFTPGRRQGPGVVDTVARLQRICDEQGLARPITQFKDAARIEESK
ncbi:cytochrome P450 [Mycolicibacterium vaccae]|uniref:Cytochrome P450 n=1 Tax=Mycolicibacterium vaccae ATCC 25954 TaxID=1194972 RepID=K0UDF5_MYCVA|nr:cytochrome P450 [Mycolicibacterium vaccae]ANI42505.1 cytochrome P450 [Mycolicibacterium vaccae 95051]EJZ05317.1 cytochrome P450 [Mycolicibacterium vaccae ATCC 25954]MCV7064416.1 cytochrome P450 [Mycolicibacterium vaccae]